MEGMELGVCCAAAEAGEVLAAGFDFAEVPARAILESDSPCQWVATNQFFPFGVRLFGVEPFDWRTYSHQLFDCAGRCGVQLMVIGSGAARHSAASQLPGEADAAFLDIAGEIASMARTRNIVIAPESLREEETDVANSARHLAEGLAQRNAAYTLDVYHLLVEWRRHYGTAEIDAAFVDRELTLTPAHVHLSDIERGLPLLDDPLVDLVLRRLLRLGFQGRVSLECSSGVMNDLPNARQRVGDLIDRSINS